MKVFLAESCLVLLVRHDDLSPAVETVRLEGRGPKIGARRPGIRILPYGPEAEDKEIPETSSCRIVLVLCRR